MNRRFAVVVLTCAIAVGSAACSSPGATTTGGVTDKSVGVLERTMMLASTPPASEKIVVEAIPKGRTPSGPHGDAVYKFFSSRLNLQAVANFYAAIALKNGWSPSHSSNQFGITMAWKKDRVLVQLLWYGKISGPNQVPRGGYLIEGWIQE